MVYFLAGNPGYLQTIDQDSGIHYLSDYCIRIPLVISEIILLNNVKQNIMSIKMFSEKMPFYLDFSVAMNYFYDAEVASISKYDFWEDGPENANYTNYCIDFMLDNDLPGNVKLSCILSNYPIFEISILSEDLILHMFSYEFEIIRPCMINSMTDVVNRYRSLLTLYNKYQCGEIKYRTHPFYLELLKKHLKLYQNSIEDIAVMTLDKKELKVEGGVEGLIKLDMESRLPLIEKEGNVYKKLVKNIIFN